jgi:hypothetical protein
MALGRQQQCCRCWVLGWQDGSLWPRTVLLVLGTSACAAGAPSALQLLRCPARVGSCCQMVWQLQQLLHGPGSAAGPYKGGGGHPLVQWCVAQEHDVLFDALLAPASGVGNQQCVHLHGCSHRLVVLGTCHTSRCEPMTALCNDVRLRASAPECYMHVLFLNELADILPVPLLWA